MNDPWVSEARRAAATAPAARPGMGPAPRSALYGLGVLAALRALGLVLIAESVARGIAALAGTGLDERTTRAIVILGALGVVLRVGGEWGTAVLARRIATGVKRELRGRLWRRLADGGESGGGTAVLAADGLDAIDDYYVQSVPATISAAVVPIIVGLRILGADWLSALVVVLTLPLVPLFMVLIGKHTQERTDAALTALTRLADHLAELARGLPVIVGLGRVREQTRALDAVQRRYRERTEETLRWAFLSALALELIATLSVAVVAVLLGLRLLNGTMELEPALVALILAPECFLALRELGAAFHASQDGLSALGRAQELLQRPQRHDLRRDGSGPVRLSGVTVRYAGSASAVIDGVSATLAGITALTGPSGAGKSTLLAALAGTLPPDASAGGAITGVSAGDVAWAPQAPQFFAVTPRAELALFGAGPEALAELGLDPLGDAATAELSPGEQRRLAVARALARVDQGARLLLLDEPTAHLDRQSADLVRAAVLRRSRRCVVVLATHEPETLALAEWRIALDGAVATPARTQGAGGAVAAPAASGSREPETAQVQEAAQVGAGLTLRSLLRPHRWVWAGSILLAALTAGFGITLTALSGWLIVRASIEEYIMYLLVAIVGVRAFGIGRAVSRYAERLVTHRATLRVVDALRLRLWGAIAARGAGSRRLLAGGAPLDYLVTLAGDLRDQLPRVLPPLGAGVLVLLAAVVTTGLVAPALTVTVAVVLLLAVVLAALLALFSERRAGSARVAARSEIVRGTSALGAAADDLRTNGAAPAALVVLDSSADQLATAERRAAWSAGLGAAVVTAGVTLLGILVPLLAPDLPAERASVVALVALAMAEPLVALVDAVGRMPALRALISRLSPVLEPAPAVAWGTSRLDAPVRELELDDVSIRYPGTPAPAVAGVSGLATRGRWLVLDGASGSGKSTLLSAIMGALPVQRGAILADDVAITRLSERDWRGRVAWCPQDAYVFDSTIRGNLLLARSREDAAGDAEMRAVLRMAGLGSLEQRLGLDARVGAGGSALSGGERQRLAVARALLTRADVVLLDEPTAHLDAPAAEAMMADVRGATEDRIVVLVSHRPDDRRAADVVLQLGAGGSGGEPAEAVAHAGRA
ncbi:thiol reductant ABC exporter subunit CydC [Microbacterium bovistercoris]|uniref:Thiol reductant ABC exporter subunit CydC n=2 Tax=Microbacterium bovistercoris TaxID=2293570 RepID=A0A371NQN5_9MICO|nr:thiol reductant ABC exporter subunit CydC [Microbacterium bovistercoris]